MPNGTQNGSILILANPKITEIVRVFLCLPVGILYVFFLYFMGVILKVFFSFPHLQENSRYVLFIHMLVNDSIYILTSFTVYVSILYSLLWPLLLCFFITTFTTSSYRVTPYNLAVMSLERYAAICHPLRHTELCNVRRAKEAILAMWIVGLFPQALSFLLLSVFANKEVFSSNILCERSFLTVHELQETFRTTANMVSFAGMWLIITYTYIMVMLVARRAGSGKIASKAGKTVLLHAFQLLLCMLSFFYGFYETYLTQFFRFLPLTNFIVLLCLPRLANPFIYGIRDEIFGKHMTKMCRSKKTSSL